MRRSKYSIATQIGIGLANSDRISKEGLDFIAKNDPTLFAIIKKERKRRGRW